MPLYEYTCENCDARFEKLVKSMTGKQKIECPECKSTKTTRSISVFAAVSGSSKSSAPAPRAGGCGRCGGTGPCAFDCGFVGHLR